MENNAYALHQPCREPLEDAANPPGDRAKTASVSIRRPSRLTHEDDIRQT
ncbi:TetR family transcriptional regulator [Burkholderia pseudomallei]|nr:TetR family transcriptional regulator [Burkholderia pseudomallei]